MLCNARMLLALLSRQMSFEKGVRILKAHSNTKNLFIALILLVFSCSGTVIVNPDNSNTRNIVCDVDGDGFDARGDICGGNDCNDDNFYINPNAQEVCDNTLDDNCNDEIDTDCMNCDVDGDTYLATGITCGGDDCNDLVPSVNPGEEEICFNECDDNCSGEEDEGCPECEIDGDGDGHYVIIDGCDDGGDDCNDSDDEIFEGAEELCDGKDNNCNGYTDEGCSVPAGCGNNVLEIGEQCDDGNENPHDGCHECFYAVPDNGQVHWVDKNNIMGNGCNDSGDGQSIPWCTLIPLNSHALVPGDSVVFRSGDYHADDGNGINRTGFSSIYFDSDIQIRNNGTSNNPIIIMAHPNDSVVLQNILRLGEGIPQWGWAVLGIYGKHIIAQGFKVEGTFLVNYSEYGILRGNEFQGLIGEQYNPTGANYSGTMLVHAAHILVRANLYKDYRGNGTGNNNGVQFYGYNLLPTEENTIIENNDFHNNVNGIFDKDNSRWNTFRKNYHNGDSIALKGAAQDDYHTAPHPDRPSYGDPDYDCYNLSAYQNIYENCGSAFVFKNGYGHSFFNNVIVASNGFKHTSRAEAEATFSFYNNIFIPLDSSSHHILAVFENIFPVYMDHNLYSPFSVIKHNYGVYSSTLSNWQSHEYDLNSNELDTSTPIFSDDQYHLLDIPEVKGIGRYGEDLGLYPNGDEQVIIGRP